ncbi:MAG: hypothetical protein H0W88_10560 [Parachlamydiaceae bacterium]|nr:hypothetical protein [Parachlamydiaceae bacterium]
MIKHWLKFFALNILTFTIILSCTSCASTVLLSKRGSYLRSYQTGNFEQAEYDLDLIVDKEIPERQYTQSKNASWILLDRATTRFAMGKTEEAVQDYAAAMESLDYYGQDLPTERAAQIMLQDETGAYQADDFEQMLARVYFALALLHQGDESNAYAILRQVEEYQQEKLSIYEKVPFTKHYRIPTNGLSKYLFAALLEKRGDKTNANILYNEADSLNPSNESSDVCTCKKENQATILVLCHNGNAPYKISATSCGSVASAVALEVILATNRIDPAISTMTGIPVPALQQWPNSSPSPTYVSINGRNKPVLPFYSVTVAAINELNQKMPVIVARGAARLLMRRAAVGYLDNQDRSLGILADITMCVINSNTRADTRSWTTLPAYIDLARFNVDSGTHDISIQVYDRGPNPITQNYKLNVNSNDLCIVHVFNIHPGVTQVLIPGRFLVNQGDSL